MITIHNDDHRLHHGQYELIDGKLSPPVEKPERIEYIIEQVREVGLGEIAAPVDHGLDPVRRVHSDAFVEFLETAHDRWRAVHGDTDALPLCWPTRTLRQVVPAEIDGQLSFYSFDAGTPITAGTWRAVTSSVNIALTGADLVRAGQRAAFALCRPPGHHAARDVYGGYCFINNAAVAAQSLLDNGAGRVAILDIDYHHGNGTQSIFYDRDDLLFISLHGHPAQEFPYFLGYEEETGEGNGDGYNVNYPLPWDTDWSTWAQALASALRLLGQYAPDCLVVSLGVDTFEQDPISRFRLQSDNYLTVGEHIAGLGTPTLFVMEGGYAVEQLGINAVNVLQGFDGTG